MAPHLNRNPPTLPRTRRYERNFLEAGGVARPKPLSPGIGSFVSVLYQFAREVSHPAMPPRRPPACCHHHHVARIPNPTNTPDPRFAAPPQHSMAARRARNKDRRRPGEGARRAGGNDAATERGSEGRTDGRGLGCPPRSPLPPQVDYGAISRVIYEAGWDAGPHPTASSGSEMVTECRDGALLSLSRYLAPSLAPSIPGSLPASLVALPP